MNSDNLVQSLQAGFHITVGATASLLESFQDTQKRDENIETLKLDWEQIAQKWAEKGEKTEQEARSFVDTLFTEGQAQESPNPTAAPTSSDMGTTTPTADATVQTELQQLTEQISTLRKELEQLRAQEDS